MLTRAIGAPQLPAKEKPPATYSIPLPPKPDFSLLDWLIGDWTGKTVGKDEQVQGDIHLSFAYILEKRFMVLREDVSLPATKTAPATHESSMGVLSASRSGPGFTLQSYSSTGFISRYQIALDGSEVYFTPEGGDAPLSGWLLRRSITRVSDAGLSETVQVAPLNRPFFDYYSARLTRATPTREVAPAH